MLQEVNEETSPLAWSLRKAIRAYFAELVRQPRTCRGIKLLFRPVGPRGHNGRGIGGTESLLVDEYVAGACATSQVRLHGC